MPCTFQLEIDQLSPQAQEIYHHTLRNFDDSYGLPPQDHHCLGASEHHTRYNWEDADRFQAYTKALDLRFEEPDSQGATRGTVRAAPEVDTVQGHYGIYRIIDQVHNARIAQACHPGLRGMEFIEIDISDELYFGDLLAVKTLAFNPGYFPRPSGSSVLPYHRTTATLPGDHCRWSAKEYLVFRRHIRTSQALLRVDERVGVIEGFSGLTRLPSSFHTGRVYLGDVFYPEHLEIRGLTPILTHLPTILRHWKTRCAVPESLRALADSADLQTTRFDHRMFQHRVKISRDNELTVNCSADWLVGSRVLVGFLDHEIEAVLVKSCNGYLTFQLSERYTGPPWVPVMVQQLGFQGAPFRERPLSREGSRRSSEAGFEGYRGDLGDRGDRENHGDPGDRGDRGDRGYRGRSRSPSEERYPQQLVGIYDPEPNRSSPDFEERYGRDEGRRSPRSFQQGQWDGPPGQDPKDSRQGYRPGSPEQRNWSPGPRQWSRDDPPSQYDDSPRNYQPRDQFSQPQESFGPQEAGFRRPETEQYQNDRQQPSEHRNQHQQFSEPQFSPQNAQFSRIQPGDHPNSFQYPPSQSEHLQDRSLYHNPLEGRCNDSPCSSDQRSLTLDQLIAQNSQNYQREKRQSYENEPQYPSEQSGRPDFQTSPQNAHFYRSQPGDRSYESQYPSSQPGQHQEHFEQPNRSQNRSPFRNPPEDRHSCVNHSQYSSEHRSQLQFSPQSAQFYRSQPEDRPTASQYPSSPQYPYDYPVIQTEQPNLRQDPQSPQGYRNQAQYRPFDTSQYPRDQSGRPDPQFSPQGAQYRNQPHDCPGNASGYPSDHHGLSQPQHRPQTNQGYRNQPDNRPSYANDPQYPSNQPGHPLETPILSQNRPQYRNQPENRYSSANSPQYPSEPRSQAQDHFKPQFGFQNGQPDRNQSNGRPANAPQHPLGQSGPSNPQYISQYPRNQSEDRQTLPRSLSPRVSTLSPSGDPIIRHSQSRSSVSQASSVSGDHFQGEQPSQRPGAPRASCSSGQFDQGYNAPAPVRNPLSYHSNQPQVPQPSPYQVPSTSRAAGYSDGLSPTGQSYYQGYATSSDGSEEDDSSSESEPEIPQVVQKRGYNALYSHFPSSSEREAVDSYSPRVPDHQEDPQGCQSPKAPREPGQPARISTSESVEPVEPAELPKPPRAQTPPFDPHNSRSWRHEHKDDICEVLEPKEPGSQGQGGHKANQGLSQPVRDHLDQEPSQSKSGSRSSGDHRDFRAIHGPSQPARDHWDPEPSQKKSESKSSVDYRTAKASSHLRHAVKDHFDHEPSQSNSGSRTSVDHMGSKASIHPRHPVKECHEPSGPGSQSSTDYGGSQTIYRPCHPIEDVWGPESINPTNRKASTASHYSADPKWPSEPENSAPEEDQHPETPSLASDTPQNHPYLPALLKHQLLVVDALNPELHIASAAASLAKTDWSLKTRGLKQRGTQVIVCKAPDAPRITGMLLDALEGSGANGLRLMRFTGETLLQIDFERCLARKLRGILREPRAWDQRIVLQAARYLTQDPLTPKLENLLRNNSHIPEMPMEEWVAWYMERWVPDVLLSTSEYLEVGTKYLRRVESVQVLGEVSEGHEGLTARFPKAKVAVIGNILGDSGGNLHPEIVEILKESFSGLRGSQLISLRSPALGAPQIQDNYLKIRSGIFPNPNFPILLIHNTSTKGTKEERNLQERKALDELVRGLIGLENEFSIPPEDLQIICIEKNQLRELRSISTPGIRIRSRQEGAEGAQGVLTRLEGSPSPRASQEDDHAPQDHPQTTPIAIICCSNYKKAAFELIRTQLPQLLSYGIQATIFIGNIDEMEVAEGWGALVARCEEVGCSYSYQMVPEERSRRYQPTKRDHMGFTGPLPEYGSSRGSSSEFGGFESPKSRSSGSGSPRSVTRGSVSPKSESLGEFENPETESRGAELLEAEESESPKAEPVIKTSEPEPEEPEPSKPKSKKPEPSEPKLVTSEPSGSEPKAHEPKSEESEPPGPGTEACEPKPEEPETSEPMPEEAEPSEPEPEQSGLEAEEPEPFETKHEESEPSEPEPKVCEPQPEEPEPSELKPKACEPKSGDPEPRSGESESSKPRSEEPEPSKPEVVASEPLEPEIKTSEPKSEPSEPKSEESEPSGPGPEACEPKPEDSEPWEAEHEVSEPKSGETEPSETEPVTSEPYELKPEPPVLETQEPEPYGLEPKPEPPGLKAEKPEPSALEPEAREPRSEEPEPSDPECDACEPKSQEPEPELKEPETSDLKPDASEPTSPTLTLEHLDLAITATVSPSLSPAIPRKSCSQPLEKDFTTPDCLLENLTVEDLEPSDQEYEDCEEFQDAQEAGNEDSDTGTYESTYSEQQMTMSPEESESLEKLEEKQ
ncbi:unnamed protein product [Caenorhabditis brenneri]